MNKRNLRLTLALVFLGIFIFLFLIISFGNHKLDLAISQGIVKIQNPVLNLFFVAFAKYSGITMIIIALIFAGMFFLNKKKKNSFVILSALGSGFVLEKIIKFLFDRTRPGIQLIQDLENSFPSGHSVFAIILFSLIIYFYKDKTKNVFRKCLFILVNVLLILLVGFSRIYTNLHWFTDVVAGFALGLFVFNVVLFYFYKMKRKI
ncbi:MAG: phosphatase PAP2 family protein [Nanoarchaeota archaeon]|nr:phosphatase PAP2 family protein [Nanoarchaeota archaeon]